MSCAPTTTRENGGGQPDLMRSARSICSRFPMAKITIPRCARAVRVLHFEPIEGRPRQPLRYLALQPQRRRSGSPSRNFRGRALGAWMEVGDQRFDSDDIQRLYESDDYPLQRPAPD